MSRIFHFILDFLLIISILFTLILVYLLYNTSMTKLQANMPTTIRAILYLFTLVNLHFCTNPIKNMHSLSCHSIAFTWVLLKSLANSFKYVVWRQISSICNIVDYQSRGKAWATLFPFF